MSVYVPTSHANTHKYSNTQVECLAKNIYHESRGGGDKGMIAVAHVTMNRVNSPSFPSTICKVVSQPFQFSWYRHSPKIKEVGMYTKAKEIASGVLSGKYKDNTKNATFFHSERIKPRWSHKMTQTLRTGGHVFYRK